jgi:hypothetical protein
MRKIPRKPKKKSPKRVVFASFLNDKTSLYTLGILVLVTGLAIGFRIFKALKTGIIYDEVYSLFNFGTSYSNALTLYKNPNNNHVINSILMNFCRIHFSDCENFFRIHTILFSGIYCISIAYLAWTLFVNRFLRFFFMILLSFQWFVFDLSFLARGYSIALAAIYGGLALLVFFLKRKMPFSRIWLPNLILVGINFLALGSMLSALEVVFALNLSYIILFSHRVFYPAQKRIKSLFVHLTAVPVFSGILLYLLYKSIYRDIFASREHFGKEALCTHLKEVLWTNMLAADSPWARWVYILFLALTAAALCYGIFSLFKAKGSGKASYFDPSTPQSFIVYTTIILFVILYVYRNVLEMSLGYARNSVFLIPLFLMFCGVLLDGMLADITHILRHRIVLAVICISVGMTAFAARPSPYAVKVYEWDLQSMVGPLMHDLKKIDPQRTWKIAVTQGTRYTNLSLQYYLFRGYKFQYANSADYDVLICRDSENITFGRWYKEDFYDYFRCRIGINPNLSQKYNLAEQ